LQKISILDLPWPTHWHTYRTGTYKIFLIIFKIPIDQPPVFALMNVITLTLALAYFKKQRTMIYIIPNRAPRQREIHKQ